MLSTPPEQWGLRAEADRANRQHAFRGDTYDYNRLLAAREPGYADQIGLETWRSRHARCRDAIATLARTFQDAASDMAIVVGNDQRELFHEDVTPAITIYCGPEIENIPLSPRQRATLAPGLAVAEEGHCPPGGAVYPGAPQFATHLIRSLVEQQFDVAQSAALPGHGDARHGIPHAYGFVYRQVMADRPPPSVPVILNVGVPFNQPTVRRCQALGGALRQALEGWKGGERVAVAASGGLTHFVIDEDLDRRVLSGLERGDDAALADLPEHVFRAGTAEIKNWITVAAAMNAAGLAFHLVDYVPCYRSEAGTGNAMAFGCWR
jgi:OH-DDVA oxygenase